MAETTGSMTPLRWRDHCSRTNCNPSCSPTRGGPKTDREGRPGHICPRCKGPISSARLSPRMPHSAIIPFPDLLVPGRHGAHTTPDCLCRGRTPEIEKLPCYAVNRGPNEPKSTRVRRTTQAITPLRSSWVPLSKEGPPIAVRDVHGPSARQRLPNTSSNVPITP
jgi:hypothetical protein